MLVKATVRVGSTATSGTSSAMCGCLEKASMIFGRIGSAAQVVATIIVGTQARRMPWIRPASRSRTPATAVSAIASTHVFLFLGWTIAPNRPSPSRTPRPGPRADAFAGDTQLVVHRRDQGGHQHAADDAQDRADRQLLIRRACGLAATNTSPTMLRITCWTNREDDSAEQQQAEDRPAPAARQVGAAAEGAEDAGPLHHQAGVAAIQATPIMIPGTMNSRNPKNRAGSAAASARSAADTAEGQSRGNRRSSPPGRLGRTRFHR